MKRSGKTIALAVVGALFWVLAVAHPWVYLRARDEALHKQPDSNATPHIYTLLSQDRALQERLQATDVIGYASEGEIDTRVGGPLQGRYYLAQYALAPTLLALASKPDRGPGNPAFSHDLVLACFRHPRQLDAFLIDSSRQSILSVAPNVALTSLRSD